MDYMPRLPDWLLAWGMGVGVWFAVVFLFVAPSLTDRAISQHIAAECDRGASSEVCECVFDNIRVDGRMDNALFVSSFGISDPRPRQNIYSGSTNGYIQYIAREVIDRERREACDIQPVVRNPVDDEVAERERRRLAEEVEKERVRFRDELDEQRRKVEEAEEETKRKIAAERERVAQKLRDARNCELGNYELVEDVERKCRLMKNANEEMMSWGELGVDKSKQFRDYLRRKWGL